MDRLIRKVFVEEKLVLKVSLFVGCFVILIIRCVWFGVDFGVLVILIFLKKFR